MHACSYAWSLPVTWQRWQSAIQSATLHANFMALCFIEPELLPMEVLHCGDSDFQPFFRSCNVDRHPMTFIYEHNPYFPEVQRMCIYELPTSRLSKVIVWQTDEQTDRDTDRQTDRHDRNYMPRRFAGGQKWSQLWGKCGNWLMAHLSHLFVMQCSKSVDWGPDFQKILGRT